MHQSSLFSLNVPTKITLRPYQESCVEAIFSSYLVQNKNKVAIELPTRAGKTYILFEAIKRLRAISPAIRVLFLVPSINLAHQAVGDACAFFPEDDIGLVQAEHNQTGRPIIIATVQTLDDPVRRATLLRAQRWERFSIIVLDEAHLSLAESYTNVLADLEHPGALRVGASATPYRGDGRSLLSIFPDGLIYYIDIEELTKLGYLLPIEAHKLQTDLDLSDLKVEGIIDADGEEDVKRLPTKLVERLERSNRYAVAFKSWQEIFKEDRALIFANDIKDCYGFYEYFARHQCPCAVMTSRTKDRRTIFDAIHSGDIRVLIGVGVFTTGVTMPRVKGAIVGRLAWMKPDANLKSMGIHQQSIGRVIGLSDEQDEDGNPIKTIAKIVYLVSEAYSSIPPIGGMGCLPGSLTKLAGKKTREKFLAEIDQELGIESTQEERETYTPLAISLKLRKLEDQIIDLFTGDGWKAYPDGSFAKDTPQGKLIVEKTEDSYTLLLEKDGTSTPLPLKDRQLPLTTVRDILAQASQSLARATLQKGSGQLIHRHEQDSTKAYLKQRRVFLPHGLELMTYDHYHQLQSLLAKHGDAYPILNGEKRQLCFDYGRIFFRSLKTKREDFHAKNTEEKTSRDSRECSAS